MLRRETFKWLDERALGMEAEMDGGLWFSESPLAPLKGGDQQVPWPVLPDIAADSPTARRLCKGYRLWVIGYRMGGVRNDGGNSAAAAPERPNKKKYLTRLVLQSYIR